MYIYIHLYSVFVVPVKDPPWQNRTFLTSQYSIHDTIKGLHQSMSLVSVNFILFNGCTTVMHQKSLSSNPSPACGAPKQLPTEAVLNCDFVSEVLSQKTSFNSDWNHGISFTNPGIQVLLPKLCWTVISYQKFFLHGISFTNQGIQVRTSGNRFPLATRDD